MLWLSRFYIGDVKRDVARDNANDGDKQQSPLNLPWPPWVMRHKWKKSYLCCIAQGGHGKYNGDCHCRRRYSVTFTNVNDPLVF